MSPPSSEGEYLLGSSEPEIERLRFQHEVWAVETERVLGAAGFDSGQTVVDLGCGPGFTTQQLAKIVGPKGKVVAVDRSARFTGKVKELLECESSGNVETRCEEARVLSMARDSVDGVLARWLFCFLPETQAVLREVHRVLRSGGVFAIIDYLNYQSFSLQPPSTVFREMFDAVYASFAASGGDLDIGGYLPTLMTTSGFEVTQLLPIQRYGEPGSPVWRWIDEFQRSYLPQLVEQGRLDAGRLEAFREEWSRRSEEPGTFVFAPPMVGIVAIKK